MNKRGAIAEAGAKTRSKVPLYLLFTATGTALMLPGALLPVLLKRWGLGDARGGALLFSLFAGCTLGSLCARGRMHRALAAGCLATTSGALALAAAGSAPAFAAFALYGIGLGLAIAATGLLVSQLWAQERRLQMVRLNLVWAMGAACGPWLALHSIHVVRLFLGVALTFAAAGAWVFWKEAAGPLPALHPESSRPARNWLAFLDVPWPLLALMFSVTGVEAATNGWLTAYAQRMGDGLNTTIGAATLLLLGSLASRVIHATRWASALPERGVLIGSTLAAAAALGLLVAWPVGIATLVAASLLGLGAGPIYPLVLAAALRRREDASVFVFAGLGSAALPLLTGALSAATHSLRIGLAVPLMGAIVMVLLVLGTHSLQTGAQANSA